MDSDNKKFSKFLTDYATTLLECGATTVRIEKNVLRIAEAYGYKSEINIYPLHVEVWLKRLADKDNELIAMNKKIQKSAINFNTVSELSRLSWQCYDLHLDLDEAIRRYEDVLSTPRIPFWVVAVLTSLANASFCRLFGGDFMSMLIVVIATVAGFYSKDVRISRYKIDFRLAIIVCSCISAILSCSGHVFGLGDTPDIALATSVLYLVPGIPYLNSVSDFINGHYISAISRLIQSCIITVCLAVGLYIGLLLMNAQVV